MTRRRLDRFMLPRSSSRNDSSPRTGESFASHRLSSNQPVSTLVVVDSRGAFARYGDHGDVFARSAASSAFRCRAARHDARGSSVGSGDVSRVTGRRWSLGGSTARGPSFSSICFVHSSAIQDFFRQLGPAGFPMGPNLPRNGQPDLWGLDTTRLLSIVEREGKETVWFLFFETLFRLEGGTCLPVLKAAANRTRREHVVKTR
jgi:hypothetical protein